MKRYRRWCGAYIHLIRHSMTSMTHGTPNSEIRLIATDSIHITPPSPSISPETIPETRQRAVSHLPESALSSSMPSLNMLLPRETIKATRPHANAAAIASPTSTRQATLPDREQLGPGPGVNGPESDNREVGDAGIKGASDQFARVFQRFLRRECVEINGPNHHKCHQKGTPANAPEQRRKPARVLPVLPGRPASVPLV